MDDAAVKSLLATTEDFDLCDGVFMAIAQASAQIDAANEPEPCLTVTLVWYSLGVIGNGGFRYRFEADFCGDPGYRKTAGAYLKIRATEAYAAFQNALSLFPDGELPGRIEERLAIYESHPDIARNSIDRQYFDGVKDTERRLATFIRSNEDAFRHALASMFHRQE